MNKSFRVFALLTIFTLVLNSLSVLILTKPVIAAGGDASDVMSSQVAGAYSTHEISYEFIVPPVAEDAFAILIPTTNGFDCTDLVLEDVTTASVDWTVAQAGIITGQCIIGVLADVGGTPASTLVVTIADDVLLNPVNAGTYEFVLMGNTEPSPADPVIISIDITAAPGTGAGSDTVSSMTVGANSSHVVSYSFLTAPTEADTFTITFPVADPGASPDPIPGFDCTGLVNTDVTTTAGWNGDPITVDAGLCEIVVTAGATPTNPLLITIADTNMVNPETVESYAILLSGSGETKTVQVAIVDSDTVNITGYVASNLFFDLDTGYGEIPTWPVTGDVIECISTECLDYSGTGESMQDNYTVDLGNLTMVDVNKSGASATHLNGSGFINSIYFDFSTNSASGGVITYKSLYGELRGPAHNVDSDLDLDIPTTDGSPDFITIGVSGYGIQLAIAPAYKSAGTGTQTVNCGITNTTYCVMGTIVDGENIQTAQPIYTTTGPIELARGKIDVAAAIDGTVVPGNYSDQVTFIATAIF